MALIKVVFFFLRLWFSILLSRILWSELLVWVLHAWFNFAVTFMPIWNHILHRATNVGTTLIHLILTIIMMVTSYKLVLLSQRIVMRWLRVRWRAIVVLTHIITATSHFILPVILGHLIELPCSIRWKLIFFWYDFWLPTVWLVCCLHKNILANIGYLIVVIVCWRRCSTI